ncbi:MAG: RidA family protein [Spirochaetaceae bacterium]|nr:MAG: RidA family protein [Spirochaetaceae bacterium]
MKPVSTPNAPRPAGHYEQAQIHGGLVYVSGQLPIDPATGPPAPDAADGAIGSIEEQTRRALANVEAVLIAAGSSLDRVVRTTVYVSDVALWPRVNETYAQVFGDHRPARTVAPTRELHFGYQVEVDAIAVVDDARSE